MQTTTPLSPETLLRHEAFVLRLARSLVRDEAAAEDVAQETLLAALRHRPRPGILRSWLARVTRHRALDHLRGERRRAAREAEAARAEPLEPEPTPAERLELEHRVVRAVLALEEPYRGVVIAAYYEGLAPTEIARRRRVAPGTVRSQLSRALEQLRERLDRDQGGERGAWSLALAGLLRARDVPPALGAAAASGTSVLSWPALLAGSATVAVAGVACWACLGPGGSSDRFDATAAAPAAGRDGTSPELVSPDATERERAAATPATLPAPDEPAPVPDARTARLQELLMRSRQVKSLLLERRLEVAPALRQRYAWLEELPDAGVTRLLERNVYGALDLPWMRGGGAYFSFTERAHDYNRRPQICLERGELRCGFYGRYEGGVLDLGQDVFRALALDPRAMPAGLDPARTAAWDLLWRDEGAEPMRLSTALRMAGFDDDADLVEGHTYLLRARSPGEFDLVVALEVAELGPGACTLAWRILDARPVEEARPVSVPRERRAGLPAPPVELEQLGEQELLAELERVRAEAETLLLDAVPADLRARHAGLLAHEDGGLVRLVEQRSPWTELPRCREGGAYWSFATRSHDYDDEPDVALRRGALEAGGFAGANAGAILDLGELPLAQALTSWPQLGRGPVFELATRLEVDQGRPRDEVIATLRGVQDRVGALRAGSADAEVGHCYLLRTIAQGEHDLLTLVEVLEADGFGVLIAWRILKSWPVAVPR